jgi:toxin ParE1/3/4
VKEIIFHPEARAEMREAVEFYEARLDGLGLRFLSAVEQTVGRISDHPEAGSPLSGELRKRIVRGFPYNVIYLLCLGRLHLSRCGGTPTSSSRVLARSL